MNKHFLRFLILNSAFFILLSAACSRKKETPPEPLPVPPIDNFALKNLLSEFPGEIKTSEYAGKVQLILFLRSDDRACRSSIVEWNNLHEEFASRGLAIVGALADHRPDDVLAVEAANLGTLFPVGLALDHVVAAFGGPSAIRAIPTAFLLSRDGTLLRTYAGYEPLQNLRDDVSRALEGQELAVRN
ncbi:MAG: TlpA disulfide reductase family protein [Kiritimatiellia bacterium]